MTWIHVRRLLLKRVVKRAAIRIKLIPVYTKIYINPYQKKTLLISVSNLYTYYGKSVIHHFIHLNPHNTIFTKKSVLNFYLSD